MSLNLGRVQGFSNYFATLYVIELLGLIIGTNWNMFTLTLTVFMYEFNPYSFRGAHVI